MSLFKKIFGDPHKRAIEKLSAAIPDINNAEEKIQSYSDDALKERTQQLKKRLQEGASFDEQKNMLNEILPEAFALVREASRRSIGLRHFDVQLIGGMVLHQGGIAEMRTGEGKTLVATLPLYLNSLLGKGCHLITPNEYLARVGGGWMAPVYHTLGVSVGVITHDFSAVYDPAYTDQHDHGDDRLNHWRPVSRKEAYEADITYGTNNEFGFDYLRDNLASTPDALVQREPFFAVIDEIDSILIDEARTPLIISAPDQESGALYRTFSRLTPQLEEGRDYNIDEKMKAVTITEEGIDRVEKLLGIQDMYSEGGIRYVHHLEQALRAQALFHKDKDYVVKDGDIIIVDEFTGRLMPGRRWSDGLHQAVEAKEGVVVQRESRTMASITFQNLFRMYDKLSGMTGTAATSAEEFSRVYDLDVLIIPTNKQLMRKDLPDRIFQTTGGKWKAVVREIKERHTKGQPILLGTTSIEKNEYLSALLKKEGIPHEMLNAKNHEHEAQVIAQAGRPGAVTVATNMAGRGVDIILGGNPQSVEEAKRVKELGGLFVLGTERHEARRIDNQLRGRAGRQGDPGETQFYVSLEDDLMRIFGPDRIKNMMGRFGIPEDVPIEHNMVSRALSSAQEKIEGFNFDARKHLLEYDDVLNRQRMSLYTTRKDFLFSEPEKIFEKAGEMIEEEIDSILAFHTQHNFIDEWNIEEIYENLHARLGVASDVHSRLLEIKKGKGGAEEIRNEMHMYVHNVWRGMFDNRKTGLGEQAFANLLRAYTLQIVDLSWANHLEAMEYMRSSVRLRAYGQRDPLIEYKNEGSRMFKEMQAAIRAHLSHIVFRVGSNPPIKQTEMHASHASAQSPLSMESTHVHAAPKAQSAPKTPEGEKVGRNDLCPCGSGKKYKKCHGK
ncbi:MAG: preprotein translocase subunit SecA [Candidatus Niyogibacteria bacterium CG10_big_fil_rev_8_21_14_0_10_46_36]|uniref:Protein translocase subunit SecA n=1 Tax=Candidatus Niyogibacteria bacterium CG10_big_fil_rev_8_21_14_0_10_46_36 TaxID=1974726 RepID=A0A2H0TED6_9BACT|nr:MAG: preprotein translocase subunit SecA [Candidatus Niyogibacteria bacterium CG10_big_fil_rev_8_21_14_0_10_46_36]